MRFKKLKKTIFITSVVAIIMFGFSFAVVPIYNKLCKITGLSTALPAGAIPDFRRDILIQFVTTNNQKLSWDFHPLQNSITIHPNETKKVAFYVKNNTTRTMTVQAIPSIVPGKAISYFHKVECFCFSQQTLKPGQELTMPLVFNIDKELPADIKTITLGYTLFEVTKKVA